MAHMTRREYVEARTLAARGEVVDGGEPDSIARTDEQDFDRIWADTGTCDRCGADGRIGVLHLGCGGRFTADLSEVI
jgi:hypothetical protein